jgi:hypothetical protein
MDKVQKYNSFRLISCLSDYKLLRKDSVHGVNLLISYLLSVCFFVSLYLYLPFYSAYCSVIHFENTAIPHSFYE